MKFSKMFAIINVILIPIAASMFISAPPEIFSKAPPAKPQQLNPCLLLGQQCMKSKAPCCTLMYQKSKMRVGTVPTTCFKFGKGVCQVNQSIENFKEYSKLVKQLNDTNFQELKNKYQNSIPSTYICPQKVIIEMNSL